MSLPLIQCYVDMISPTKAGKFVGAQPLASARRQRGFRGKPTADGGKKEEKKTIEATLTLSYHVKQKCKITCSPNHILFANTKQFPVSCETCVLFLARLFASSKS